MNYRPKSPNLFPLSALTAATQYPGVKREFFKTTPIAAALEATTNWITAARSIGLQGLQLAAALHLPDAYLPPEQMLDPVASHGPWRTYTDGSGEDLTADMASTIIDACQGNGEEPEVSIFDIGFFENLLHSDTAIRSQIHQHLLRCARASQRLAPVGCAGVSTFIGGDPHASMDENVVAFVDHVIPLLRQFKELGQTLWFENCPMPGWTPVDRFHQNIASTPFMWALLHRIAEKHGVGDVMRITYDASHSILMGSRPIWDFMYLKAVEKPFLIDRIHGKGQNRRVGKVAAHGLLGQRAGTGIYDLPTRTAATDPKVLGNAWKRMTAEHTLPGVNQYNPHTNYLGQTVDWMEHQIGVRSVLGLDPKKSVFHLEHEWSPARDQNFARTLAALELSARFVSGIDAAADETVQAEQWCKQVGLPWEAVLNPLEHIPGLEKAMEELNAIPI